MANISQTDIDNYVSNIVSSLYSDDYGIKITNYINFLTNNYTVLQKKTHNTSLEHILIKNVHKTFRYTSPELLLLYVQTVAFYLALEHFEIPCSEWE